jgi:hypothetical protein
MEPKYASPFNLKEELKNINEKYKDIKTPKLKKLMIEQHTKDLRAYADMIAKMSKFVNSKNKNK